SSRPRFKAARRSFCVTLTELVGESTGGGGAASGHRLANLRDDGAEFLVRHQPLFRRAEGFHPLEYGAMLLGGRIEPELVQFDLDIGEAAFLSQRDVAIGGKDVCRIRLDRGGHVKLGSDAARFTAEDELANNRLPGVDRVLPVGL